jgi:hypothetical protein
VLKTLKNRYFVIRLSIWLVLSLSLFLTPFLDNGSLGNSIGAARSVLFLILIPGAFIGLRILKIRELPSSIIIGSAILISFIIPIHALLSKFGIAWLLTIGLSIFSFYLLLRFNKYLYIEELKNKVVINLQNVISKANVIATGSYIGGIAGSLSNSTVKDTSFDGLNLIASAGTVTGVISVYGFNV